MSNLHKPLARNVLINVAALMIIVAGLRTASSMVVRLLLAFFIAFVFGPLFFWLTRKKVPKALSIIIVLLVIVAFGSVLGLLIGSSVNDFTETWPVYQDKFVKVVSSTIGYLNERGVEIPRETVLEVLNPGTIMNVVGSTLTTLTGMLSDTVFLLITVVFVLMEAVGLPLKVTKIWGRDSHTMKELNRFADIMQNYIILKTLISLATGIFAAISMMIVGIDFALLWGLLAFLLNYVP
ncbi:AI-2E family transporter, partial [candidate division KSB1 bacterium]|nr:AI-2E family transporter [candidate division KSB1 bacterium]